jgi:hypothetical protein
MPIVIPLLNEEKGIFVDSVIYIPADISIIFSFYQSFLFCLHQISGSADRLHESHADPQNSRRVVRLYRLLQTRKDYFYTEI